MDFSPQTPDNTESWKDLLISIIVSLSFTKDGFFVGQLFLVWLDGIEYEHYNARVIDKAILLNSGCVE